MDNVNCNGSETSLFDCDYITNHNCGHWEDVGLVCLESCSTEGEVRLVGGQYDNEGRVEICKDQQWTTICDDGWDNMDAAVACRSAGLESEGKNPLHVHFYALKRKVYNVKNRLRAKTSVVHVPGLPEMALVNTYTSLMGSGTGWNNTIPFVLLSAGARAYVNLQFGLGWGVISYSNFGCTGSENNLTECSSTAPQFCSHYDDAGVQCPGPCVEGDIRLVDGNSNSTDGRVEVCRNSTWGTICDNTNSWSTADAMVVCRQLQLPFTG